MPERVRKVENPWHILREAGFFFYFNELSVSKKFLPGRNPAGTDAADALQIFESAEIAILLTVHFNSLGQSRPDPGEEFPVLQGHAIRMQRHPERHPLPGWKPTALNLKAIWIAGEKFEAGPGRQG